MSWNSCIPASAYPQLSPAFPQGEIKGEINKLLICSTASPQLFDFSFQDRALSTDTVRGFPIMFHARGVWIMVGVLGGVFSRAVVQTLSLTYELGS